MHAPAPLFAGFGEALVGEPGLADPPRAPHPQPEVVKVEIDDGCRVEGQQLADEQPADDRNPERAAQFRTLAEPDRQRTVRSAAPIRKASLASDCRNALAVPLRLP